MDNDEFIPDTRTDEQRAESYRYWATKTDAEKWGETVRLSIERFGTPIGDLQDGPLRKYRINPDGTRTLINETCGPNPLRHSAEGIVTATFGPRLQWRFELARSD